jgi:gliding-associated putative ABC transporter substrate-binding component GldG
METNKIKSRTELIVYILIVLGIIAVVNYLGAGWFSRVDLTDTKAYSISPATKKTLKGLDDIINIKVYFSKNLPPHMLQIVTNVKDILAEYKAFGGKKLRITWIDPMENDKTKSEARSMGIPEVQLQTFEQDKQQVMNGYLGIAVLFADRKEVLPVVQNLQNLEYDLTLAIMKVARATTPKVGIVKVDTMPEIPPQYMAQMPKEQQAERTETKFAPLYEKLKETYSVQTIDVSKGTPVDNDIKTLVIPGSAPFSDRSLFEIDQFFMKGGKLIVLADAMKIDFQQYYGPMAVPVNSKLLDLLQSYGVKVEPSMVLDASCGQVQIPQKIGPYSMNVAVPYPYFVRIGHDGLNSSNPAVAQLTDVVLPWPNPLSLLVDQASPDKDAKKTSTGSSVKATILVQSSKKSWTASGSIDLNPQQQWQMPAQKTLKQQTLAAYLAGDFKSYFAGKSVPPVNTTPGQINASAADASRSIIASNTNGHLVVVGNSGFVSAQNAAPQNVLMLVNLVDWLSQDENLIGVRTRAIKDRTMDADLLKKGSSTPGMVRIFNIILMPLLVIIIGLFIFFRRREHISVTPPPTSTGTTGEKN